MFLEKEAQLNALQQQINPHFLYNTLESIKWLAYKKGVMEICDMATALGRFFRGAITKGKDFVLFEEEIEHLKNYIFIQKIRYQGKFDVIWEIDEEIKKYKTIKLILQPIVENAIIHGIENMEKNGLVTIQGSKNDDQILFEIKDNGVGMDQEQLQNLKDSLELTKNENESIGLRNVYRRLKLYFGEKSNFEIESNENQGTTVKLAVPVIN